MSIDTPAETPNPQPKLRYATLVVHLEMTEEGAREFQESQDDALETVLAQIPEDADRINALDHALNMNAAGTLVLEAAIAALEVRKGKSDPIEDEREAANQMDPTSGPIIEADEHGNRVSVSLTLLPYSPLRKG